MGVNTPKGSTVWGILHLLYVLALVFFDQTGVNVNEARESLQSSLVQSHISSWLEIEHWSSLPVVRQENRPWQISTISALLPLAFFG